MSIHRIVRLNLVLVLGIGLYGFLTDEPYWRSNGHGPWPYDFLFWVGLALNGPSGLAADYLLWFLTSTGSRFELQFVLQYALWLLLLWPQWRGYEAVAIWCIGHRRREIALHAMTAAIVAIGSIAAYEAWIFGRRPSGFIFIDRYFWFVRIAGVALAGVIILVYGQFSKDNRAG